MSSRCQGITKNGLLCSRTATVKLDLSKQRTVLGYNLPRIDCCFLCTQHAAIYLGISLIQLGKMLADLQYSWDEYIFLNPEYLEQLKS